MPFPLSVEQKQTAFREVVWAAFFFAPSASFACAGAHLRRHYLGSTFYNA